MADKRSVLVVDDDSQIRSLLSDLLKSNGYQVVEAKTGAEAVAAVEKQRPDLVMMDIKLPDMDGLDVLKQMKRERPELEIIVMTAFGGSSSAIRAMEHGAYDYVTKPFDIDDLLATLRRVFEHAEMAEEVSALRLELGKSAAERERIVGASRPMLEVYKLIGKVAASDATVLITGESGTGKELVAEALHRASKRNPYPLIKVSCAALPETLLEAELFGHEKGSFTGAMTMRKGRFEAANKGTIFLDEIGEMTLGTQTKLLRILQEREFERLGSNVPIKVDIRVITATNRDLAEEVEKGRFREDLYYRLNVIHIHMPPLRERMEDLPLLVEHFLAKYRWRPDAIPTTISEEAMARLMEHDWPGNVRELENAIERAVVLSRGMPIMPEHLPLAESPVAAGGPSRRRSRKADTDAHADADEGARAEATADPGAGASSAAGEDGAADSRGNGDRASAANGANGRFKEEVEALEKRLIMEALERNKGNRSKAAQELGIYRRLLYAKMREYGLEE
ncbi:MAG TPA: sigma-54 dependent transcriptional regulator [candidate division Zixibacteria bacterium]|nr:sigma-54 dependent transcriptional regulator [candidate division Zixibacteria bacterium]